MSFEDIPDDSEPREPGDGGFENFSDDEMLFPDNTDPVTADSDGEPDIEDGPGIVREPLDAEDQPDYDLVQFETDAIARAREFALHGKRLALFEFDDGVEPMPGLQESGAQYDLPDGRKLEVKHEVWDENPQKNATRLTITNPPVTIVGPDGQRRHVTLTRSVYFRSFRHLQEQGVGGTDADDVVRHALKYTQDVLEDDVEHKLVSIYERARLERRLDPTYRPGELVRGETYAAVECKLPNSPNYREERYSEDMPHVTRLAYKEALERAGAPAENPPYGTAEHAALMGLLSSVDPISMNAQPLDRDFNDRWRTPRRVRDWWPDRNII